ncbi:MAG TPA: hypothetical protein VKZ49_12355, partial [Polyangiaceae bacterium]|nr:hypothetical protein [Polyangiaceae bacterium]
YRLQTPLGDEPESLSLSATYLSILAGAALGDPDGLQHGLSFDLAAALDGIPQEVLTPSYVMLRRLPPRMWIWGRAGTPVVLEPDLNLGLEAGAGAAWLVRAGIGLTAELIGSIFYGAATLDRPVTVIPMLSLQVGVRADYEMLP